MEVFAKRLKELREERKLSQNQLAKLIGVTHTAIRLWELNERTVNADAIIALAKFFNVSSDYLLGLADY